MIRKGFICDYKTLTIIADCIYNDNPVNGNIRARIIDPNKGIGMNKGLKDDYILYPTSNIFNEKDHQGVAILLSILREERDEYERLKALTLQELKKRAITNNGSLAVSENAS